jgi:hypothetical protein
MGCISDEDIDEASCAPALAPSVTNKGGESGEGYIFILTKLIETMINKPGNSDVTKLLACHFHPNPFRFPSSPPCSFWVELSPVSNDFMSFSSNTCDALTCENDPENIGAGSGWSVECWAEEEEEEEEEVEKGPVALAEAGHVGPGRVRRRSNRRPDICVVGLAEEMDGEAGLVSSSAAWREGMEVKGFDFTDIPFGPTVSFEDSKNHVREKAIQMVAIREKGWAGKARGICWLNENLCQMLGWKPSDL